MIRCPSRLGGATLSLPERGPATHVARSSSLPNSLAASHSRAIDSPLVTGENLMRKSSLISSSLIGTSIRGFIAFCLCVAAAESLIGADTLDFNRDVKPILSRRWSSDDDSMSATMLKFIELPTMVSEGFGRFRHRLPDRRSHNSGDSASMRATWRARRDGYGGVRGRRA